MLNRYLTMLSTIFLVVLVSGSTSAQTGDELRAIHQEFCTALNAHDVNQLMTFYADDAVLDFVPVPPPVSGKGAIREWFESLFRAFPDFQGAHGLVLVSGNILIHEHVVSGTHLGDWMGIPATGKKAQVRHIDIFEFEGGKIKRDLIYQDNLGLLMQLGVMPASDLPELKPSFTLSDPEPTGKDPLEADADVISRWNSHDMADYAKVISSDAEFFIGPLGIPMDCKEYIAAEELYILAFPDVVMKVVHRVNMGDGWVLTECVWNGTNDGPYFGLPATGRSVKGLRGVTLARYDNGLITNLHIYFDNLTLLTQLGIVQPSEAPAVSSSSWGKVKGMFRR